MNADLEQLVVLQAIDLELAHDRKVLADGPKRVARVEADLAEARTSLAATEKALAAEESKRRRLESDAEDRRIKLAKLRKQMDAATSTVQVTALEHEMAFAEKAISGLEDEELLSLEVSEGLEAKLPTDQGVAERTAQSLEAAKADVAEIAVRTKAAMAEREAERVAVRAGVDEAKLSQYDRVSKSRGSGVSEAREHKCSACQMMVRAQRWNDLTGREFENEIFNCETCGRMLYWDPRNDRPVPWAPGDRLRAARALEV